MQQIIDFYYRIYFLAARTGGTKRLLAIYKKSSRISGSSPLSSSSLEDGEDDDVQEEEPDESDNESGTGDKTTDDIKPDQDSNPTYREHDNNNKQSRYCISEASRMITRRFSKNHNL
jgi:hypothetical protein